MKRQIVSDATSRFSNRVQDYIQYRPHYPQVAYDHLQQTINLNSDWIVADIGSGTGLLAELFLAKGHQVYGVEPNRDMRLAAEALLAHYPSFQSVAGSAENTGLAPNNIDLVTAGQAFHWFDPVKAKAAFKRGLKMDGWVVLVWNSRSESDPFMQAYEAILYQHAAEYRQVSHKNIDEALLADFFGGQEAYQFARLPNSQTFDFQGLCGRALSSSYTPQPGQPNHEAMMQALAELFQAYSQDGAVHFAYETELYYGQL